MRTPRGFTLIEILVATSLFVVMGMMVMTILKQSLDTWTAHETSRDAYDRALTTLNLVCADVEAMATDIGREPAWRDNRYPGRVRFTTGVDMLGNPYLIFTRYLDDELGNTTLAYAGEYAVDEGAYNYYHPHGTPWNLRAPAGLAEVAYRFGVTPRWRVVLTTGYEFDGEWISDPQALEDLGYDLGSFDNLFATSDGYRGIDDGDIAEMQFLGYALYRGFQAPPPPPNPQVGPGTGSLFNDFPPRDEVNDAYEYGIWLRPALDLKYNLVTDGILYLGIQGWVPPDPNDPESVGTWELNPFLPTPEDVEPPYPDWDTNGQTAPPESLLVTVTAESMVGVRTRSVLASDLNPGDQALVLRNAPQVPDPRNGAPFLLIGDDPTIGYEWVWYTGVSGNTVTGLTRAVRGTVSPDEAFPAGTTVRWGVTLRREISLPTTRAPSAAYNPNP